MPAYTRKLTIEEARREANEILEQAQREGDNISALCRDRGFTMSELKKALEGDPRLLSRLSRRHIPRKISRNVTPEVIDNRINSALEMIAQGHSLSYSLRANNLHYSTSLKNAKHAKRYPELKEVINREGLAKRRTLISEAVARANGQ